MANQTGPATPEGKQRASRNAQRHGALSRVAALAPVEDPAEWDAHRDGIFEALEPENGLERSLTENIAWALWKLRRVGCYQQAITRNHMNEVRQQAAAIFEGTDESSGYPPGTTVNVESTQAMRTILPEVDLARIMRYEAHLHRQYIQTLRELEAIQARRRGEPSPLARLDMSGAPSPP